MGACFEILKDLELAGFVTNEAGLNPQTERPLREARYRIKDNYIRFYLHYIEPHRKAIADGLFEFSSLEQLSGWESDLGLQFENLILNHVNLLFPKLGLERSLVLSASPYRQHATRRVNGCQIDLLIQTRNTLFVVETKRCRQIRHEVIADVQKKVKALAHVSDLSVRTALVYEGELAPVRFGRSVFRFCHSRLRIVGVVTFARRESRARDAGGDFLIYYRTKTDRG